MFVLAPATASPLPSRRPTPASSSTPPALGLPLPFSAARTVLGRALGFQLPVKSSLWGGKASGLYCLLPHLNQGSGAGLGTVASPSEWHPCSGS